MPVGVICIGELLKLLMFVCQQYQDCLYSR